MLPYLRSSLRKRKVQMCTLGAWMSTCEEMRWLIQKQLLSQCPLRAFHSYANHALLLTRPQTQRHCESAIHSLLFTRLLLFHHDISCVDARATLWHGLLLRSLSPHHLLLSASVIFVRTRTPATLIALTVLCRAEKRTPICLH